MLGSHVYVGSTMAAHFTKQQISVSIIATFFGIQIYNWFSALLQYVENLSDKTAGCRYSNSVQSNLSVV